MKKNRKISVLGDGGWGTTLSILLFEKGMDVVLWSPFADYAEKMSSCRLNSRYLPGVALPPGIKITSDFRQCCPTDLIVAAVPSKYLRGVLVRCKPYVKAKIPVVSVVKGIEEKTLLRMSQVIKEVWHSERLAVLSGPTIASEVVRHMPTAAVVSSSDEGFMKSLQDIFMSPAFRIYRNPDMVGVELGGSLKNIIAIACGISDGLGFGTNAKAAIVSRGLAEMSRLGMAMGATSETFSGISGLGDLITTCFNASSRNHSVGERIGKGEKIENILSSMTMVAEGVSTAPSALGLSRKHRVPMPITQEICNVLFHNSSAKEAVRNLMERRKKAEA